MEDLEEKKSLHSLRCPSRTSVRPLSDVSFIDDDHYLPRNLHYYLDRRALAAGGSPRGVASLSASANIPGGWELPRFMRETRI